MHTPTPPLCPPNSRVPAQQLVEYAEENGWSTKRKSPGKKRGTRTRFAVNTCEDAMSHVFTEWVTDTKSRKKCVRCKTKCSQMCAGCNKLFGEPIFLCNSAGKSCRDDWHRWLFRKKNPEAGDDEYASEECEECETNDEFEDDSVRAPV